MTTGLAFAVGAPVRAYGDFFARLRWRRAVLPDLVSEISPGESAAAVFGGAESWVVVRDPAALPVGSWSGRTDDLERFRSGAATLVSAWNGDGTASHTIRELEMARGMPAEAGGRPPALLFRLSDFSPPPFETAGELLARVEAAASPLPGAFALVAADPSAAERPELSGRIPPDAQRLVDVGCGSGGTSAAMKARSVALEVTGLELDPDAARRAAAHLDRVLVGDAGQLLASLAAGGELFDAFLMGDVLEHTADPVGLLAAARAAAAPDATLVASVPNAAHISIVRDLLLGRFDPAPAGLEDAGHLRWFTRAFLVQCLEEAGWRVEEIEGASGGGVRDAEPFDAFFSAWPGPGAGGRARVETLGVYQWIAVARAA
ncbi:MAG: class I SAM-dependent methyltransferase [Acidobacteriota bacterium]|nr:class I SAM-dependent methyltransferase [Acidobacteriota bacterium]